MTSVCCSAQPKPLRKAVELRELGELSTEETQCMRVKVSAVRARVFHKRGKLREILKRHGGAARTYGSRENVSGQH